MKVAVFQLDTIFGDSEANCQKVEHFVETEATDADIIILPEMFTTGYTMSPELYACEEDDGGVKWIKEAALKYKKAFCGSICVTLFNQAGEKIYVNRLYFITEDGVSFAYDKRHLFRMASEHQHYTEGHSKQIIHYKGFKILPLVCYDLRFPVWSRNIDNQYDIVIYVAAWPEARRYPWSLLLRARAVENLAYCIGVNRVGVDHKGIIYSGDSAVIDFKGVEIWAAEPYKEQVGCIELNKEPLDKFRESFPAHLDSDKFHITEL